MEDMEDTLEDEELEDEIDGAGDLDGEEPAAAPAATARAAPGDEDVESIQDLLVKQESRAEEEEEDDSVLTLGREERLEPLAAKVVPPQPNEFTCRRCYLVKHRSQLKDRNKMLCRDCA